MLRFVTPTRRFAPMTRVLFASALAGFATPAAAQSIMLDLGAQTVIYAPEAEVELPLTLNAPAGGPVEITMEIGFPPDLVSFQEATPGTSSELAGGTVSAQEKTPAAGQAERVIAVELKSPKPLATGTLVTFKFRLGPKAAPGSEIPIRGLSRSATASGGKALEVQGADGLITVIEPLPPCFFYMH